MEVRGYYVWVKNQDGEFSTIFLPTTDYDTLTKYFKIHCELEYLGNVFETRIFNENEKTEIFKQMLELNNL